MPQLAALAAAAGTAIAAGAAAAGTAIAAGAGAAATAIGGAVGGLTLSGVSMGATIVGTGMSMIGMATGNKTLSNIGMGMSMAGGLGSVGSGLSNMAKQGAGNAAKGAAKVTGKPASTNGILNSAAQEMDDALMTSSVQDLGKKAANANRNAVNRPDLRPRGYAQNEARMNGEGLNTFDSGKYSTEGTSANSFWKNADKVGSHDGQGLGGKMGNFDSTFETSYLDKINNTLTKYNPTLSVLGGMGEAYMINESMDLRRELQDKQLKFDQQIVDFEHGNNSQSVNVDTNIGLNRNFNGYQPLLRS